MNFVTYSQLHKDAIRFARILPRDFDLIVGVPRSGLLPALLLSLHYNLPLSELQTFAEDRIFKSGARGHEPEQIHNVLVIDDSSLTGGTINGARKLLSKKKGYNIRYAAFYATDISKRYLDYHLRVVPVGRCFEWNIFHHIFLQNACMDIDGVLCYAPAPEQDDDDGTYIDFLMHATPLYVPTVKVKCLVTCRLSKYRKQTEEWLAKWNVRYDELYMMNYPTKSERIKAGRHADFKAEIYLKTKTELFIEDTPQQAQRIAKIAKKPVLCVGNWVMY